MKESSCRVPNATRAAMAEGVVVGGGVALLRAESVLDELSSSGDRAIGVGAVYDALAPLRQISENAGQEGSVVVNNILSNDSPSYGYNAEPMSMWICSGRVIVLLRLQEMHYNQQAIGGLVLTTETLVADEPKPDSGPEMNMGGMGMGYMGGMGF